MERSLGAFVLTHSARAQAGLLALTVATFPVLYLTLEIPKVIVNDAIQGTSFPASFLGLELEQVPFLMALSVAFMLAVAVGGLMKMRLNTMKGVVAERLLRRLRFLMIERLTRFPLAHFRRRGQGEMIAMVTAEAEPLGGVMGDFVAQPVFQAGQMLTILVFLFVQNVWFGLAAVALIPVQAYLIPLLQRRINTLQKERVRRVRTLSEWIGETVQGVEDLRANGGVRRRLAGFSGQLHTLFDIRFEIYKRKFFMKFLNNFINQVTPFFFYALGGYLVIQGELTVGALVAAIAAHKDLSSPWRELLTFYTQYQEMSLRYRTVTDQFAPAHMFNAALFDGRAESVPSLKGSIEFHDATVSETDGAPVLDGLRGTIPAGAMVGVEAAGSNERRAIVRALSRGVELSSGRIEIAGVDLSSAHQDVISRRIGVVGDAPQLLNTTIGENATMALATAQAPERAEDPVAARRLAEAVATGNSLDLNQQRWIAPEIAGATNEAELQTWWLRIVEALGSDQMLFQRGMGVQIDPAERPALAEGVLRLRPRIAERMAAAGLDDAVERFDPGAVHCGLAVAENLMFAIPNRALKAGKMAADPQFRKILKDLELDQPLLDLAIELLRVLVQTFGAAGAGHPIFQRVAGLDAEGFERLRAIGQKVASDDAAAVEGLDDAERGLLLTLPVKIAIDQLGAELPLGLQSRILALRQSRGAELLALRPDLFTPIAPDRYLPGLSILENAIYGKAPPETDPRGVALRRLVCEALDEEGLRAEVAMTIWDVEAGVGGGALPQLAIERIAAVRAVIKRPDVLILHRMLASLDDDARIRTRDRLRALLPEATIIFVEPHFSRPQDYDLMLRIDEGRFVGQTAPAEQDANDPILRDFAQKQRVLSKVKLFEGLSSTQLRLLAFSSEWETAPAGAHLFRRGDSANAAYLVVKGVAELRWPQATLDREPITTVEPGRMIGDLSVIREERRRIDMIAKTDVKVLKIGGTQLREIIEHDPAVAVQLLRTVSGYLMETSQRLSETDDQGPPPKKGGDGATARETT